jgi:hypothetical protein
MQIITSENKLTKKKHFKGKVRTENDVHREMRECLTRLKVWQTENLMAPHGMDRYAYKNLRVPGHEQRWYLSNRMAERKTSLLQ